MPYVGRLPADETIGSELSKLFDTITKVKQQRRQRDIEGGLLRALAAGGTPEEMQRQISEVMLQQPSPSEGLGGFLGGILDAFNPMTAAQMERTSLEDAIMGRMLQTSLDPMAGLQAEYMRERIGATKALTKQREQPKAGTTREPLTTSNLKNYSVGMDTVLKKARNIKVGPNYTKEALLKAWQNFKDLSGWESLNQDERLQLWTLWNNKIQKRRKGKGKFSIGLLAANEYEWDLNDPDVIAASGLEQREITEAEPATIEEFLQTVQGIEDEAEAKAYYNKWVSKWQ